MDGNRFIYQATLKQRLDVDLGGLRTVPTKGINYRSAGAVAVSAAGSGKAADPNGAIAKAGADLAVAFSKENAVLLDLHDCSSTSVEDQLGLQDRLLEAWVEGDWRPEWCVVTEVVEAASATALICSKSGASLGLKASAEVEIAESISLAGLGLELEAVHEDGIGLAVLTESGATPLVKGLRLKKRFWSKDPKIVIEGLDRVEGEEPFDRDLREPAFDLLGED